MTTEGIMKNTELTQLQKKLFDYWKAEIPSVTAEIYMPFIMRRFRETCYHESGHIAGAVFFGDDYSHFCGVSCIPSTENLGVVSHERWANDDFW